MGLILSIFWGFAPMLLFSAVIYWLDRYEKEPRSLLLGVFLWGMLIAGLGAFIINTSIEVSLLLITDSEATATFTTSTLVAPVIEELLKGLAVVLVYIRRRKEFDSVLDGIIYASITALGFAALENSYYIFTLGYLKNGFEGLWFMVFVRVFMVGWQHPFYTAFFGIGLAMHRMLKAGFWRNVAPGLGLGFAMLTHSLHNLLASSAPDGLSALAATTYDWIGWVLMVIFIIVLIRREKFLLVTHLSEEISFGVITPEQFATACSPSRRLRANWAALGKNHWHQTRRFYQLCGEIAHKKQQFRSLGDEQGNSALIDHHRNEMLSLVPYVES